MAAAQQDDELDLEESEDEDYDPSTDPTGEPGEGARAKRGGRRKKEPKEQFIRRGAGALPGEQRPTEEDEVAAAAEADAAAQPEPAHDDPRAAERKAKADALWAKLNVQGSGAAPPAQKRAADVLAAIAKGGTVPAARKPAQPAWMAQLAALGARPKAAAAAPDAAKEAAAAALAAASSAVSLVINKPTDGVVVVKETRRFAGQDVEVTKTYEAGTKAAKEAQKRAAPPATGLDAVLSALEKKRKLSVLDKTRMDWDGVKAADARVAEDLEAHKKSAETFLGQQSFLKDVELREYERERDARLAADPRSRARL